MSEAGKLTTSIKSLRESSGSNLPPDLTPKVTAAIRGLIPDSLPGYIRKLRGFLATMEAINAYCEEHNLPRFWDGNLIDYLQYRVTLGKPGGVPFSYPLRVFQRNLDGEDQPLGETFRIIR